MNGCRTMDTFTMAAETASVLLLVTGCTGGHQTADAGMDADDPCTLITPAANVGSTCTSVPGDPDCGTGGICLDLGAGAFCWQLCVPEECESVCSSSGLSCLPVLDSAGDNLEIVDDVPMGVCSQAPTGTQGLYDPCGTVETGACQVGLSCLEIADATVGSAFCSPPCSSTVICAERDGIAGECVLMEDPDATATQCALLCDLATGEGCPTGMACFEVAGGVCLWPAP